MGQPATESRQLLPPESGARGGLCCLCQNGRETGQKRVCRKKTVTQFQEQDSKSSLLNIYYLPFQDFAQSSDSFTQPTNISRTPPVVQALCTAGAGDRAENKPEQVSWRKQLLQEQRQPQRPLPHRGTQRVLWARDQGKGQAIPGLWIIFPAV